MTVINQLLETVRPAIGQNVLRVLSVFVGVFLVLIMLGAFLLAKTGLVVVPVLSSFYTGPSPVRTVAAEPLDETALRVLVSSRLLQQSASGKPPPYVFTVSEKELTGGLVSAVTQALRDQDWKPEKVQLAIVPGYMEFFGMFRRGNVKADFRVRFMPVVEQGGVRFTPTDIRFGDYSVHPKLAERLAGIMFARDFGTWIITFGDAGVQKAVLKDGFVEITASPRAP